MYDCVDYVLHGSMYGPLGVLPRAYVEVADLFVS